ncbi:MAG: endonuclease III [Magnetococcales bacterium]|nr:endonuclease III [Magnetococcales bacterium]NGZ06102.1 endonuclease III [Magnetococcales bacterium]
MEHTRIQALFEAFRAADPHPVGALRFQTPFQLLVAVVLSAQSTDVGVNRVTPGLFALAPDPEAMVTLGEEAIREQIRSLGLFNTKAKHLHALSRILVEQYGGQVPQSRAALQALPGVGRKSANVVLNIAFGQPTLAVDTHVFRLSRRLGLAYGNTPEAVERELLQCVPESYLLHAHHWLILHGRHVCTARKPACFRCIVRVWCPSDQNDS